VRGLGGLVGPVHRDRYAPNHQKNVILYTVFFYVVNGLSGRRVGFGLQFLQQLFTMK